MRTVFHALPWIMPEEPESIQEFFRREGVLKKYRKGQMVPHGRKGDGTGVVSLVKKGGLIFYFLDFQNNQETFSLSLAGRALGDLELFTDGDPCLAMAECYKATELYVVSGKRYEEFLGSSVELMRDYAVSANRKHWCTMEGMIANYTLPLKLRLCKFLYAVIASHYPPRKDDWNPVPIQITVTDIAKFISSNRSWVSHMLNRWIERGYLKKDGRFLMVHGSFFDLFESEIEE